MEIWKEIHGLRVVLGWVPVCVCVPLFLVNSNFPKPHLLLSPSFTLELPFFISIPEKRAKGSGDEQIAAEGGGGGEAEVWKERESWRVIRGR